MPCFVDKESCGEVYKDCCLDYGIPEDCGTAFMLAEQRKGKADCRFWKESQSLIDRLRFEASKRKKKDTIKKILIEAADALNKV